MSENKLIRKLTTAWSVVKHSKNWPELLKCRMNWGPDVHRVELREGLVLECDLPLQEQWGQVFEPAIADVYGIKKGDWDLIVDVGANIGSFSCMAAFHHPGVKIFSFEPGDQAHDQALRNIAANGLSGITLTKKPVTKDGRLVEFFICSNRGASSLYGQSGGEKVSMASATLDTIDFSKSRSLFIKLDCEGAEGELIEWVVENLGKLPPAIEMRAEYHDWCPVPIKDSCALLEKAGFRTGIEYHFAEPYLVARRG